MGKNKTPKLPWIAVLLGVAALCVGAYFFATRIVDARMPTLREVIAVPASASQKTEPLGNGLIYYDGGSLHALDTRGRQIWAYPAGSYADFSVGVGGVTTWSGTMLSLLNAETGASLFSGNMEGKIIAARLGKVYAAVQLIAKDSGSEQSMPVAAGLEEHNSTMFILDHGGHSIDKIDLRNQTVLDFGFFNNGQLLWVLSLDTEGTAPICNIRTYKPGKMLTGDIPDTQQLLYDVLLLTNKIRVVGTTHIKDFDYQSNEIIANRILVYGWRLMDVDEQQANPLMVFVPTSQADGTVSITDLRLIQGQTDVNIRLPGAAKQVFVKGDTAYAFSSDRVTVCRLGESEPAIYALPMYIDNVLSLTGNHAAIVASGTGVYMIPLYT